jgi:hypothetical protein
LNPYGARTLALWLLLCLAVFGACLFLPLGDFRHPLLSSFIPFGSALFVTTAMGLLVGMGGVFFQRFMSSCIDLPGPGLSFTLEQLVAETHVGGSVFISGGLGLGVNCMLAGSGDFLPCTIPLGFGLGLAASTHLLFWVRDVRREGDA